MDCSDIQKGLTVLLLSSLVGCGGGGGGSSSPTSEPTPPEPPASNAVDDTAATLVNTPISINVTANDASVDSGTLSVETSPVNGTAEISGGSIVYTPNSGFAGSDALVYQISGQGGSTLQANVRITVSSLTATNVATQTLEIPESGYTSQNNAELGADVLVSPPITFSLDPNVVSFSIALTGGDVGDTAGNLFIAELTSSQGSDVSPLRRFFTFCDPDFCSGVLPRRPDQTAPAGTWSLRLGTLDTTLARIDLSDMELVVAQRIGPPATNGATLRIRPFLTASSVTTDQLDTILERLTAVAATSNLTLEIDEIQLVTDGRFEEVSRNFTDPVTSELMQLGSANRINLFFIEDFSGAGGAGLLGISGGLPGPFGQVSQTNGVLINATANLGESPTGFARNTAEIAFHEMGHFLGLYHTTERGFDPHDVIDDTPECLASNDRTTLGIQGTADVDECPDGQNPMFWNTDFRGNKQPLSADQQEVIFRSPIAIPN